MRVRKSQVIRRIREMKILLSFWECKLVQMLWKEI